jgi:membrane protein DedA with SNARE-associated domain
MAYKHILQLQDLILVAFIGLIIGDYISYALGQRLGETYLKEHAKKLRVDEQKYDYFKDLINKNLIKALFIGRSNGFTRWIVPFLAGAHNAPIRDFSIANIFTAFFWASAFLLGGYYLGETFEVFGKYIGIGVIVATLISVLIYKIFKHLEKIEVLKNEDFKFVIVSIFGLIVFSKIAEEVFIEGSVGFIDKWVKANMPVRSTFYDHIFSIVSYFNELVIVPVVLLIVFFLFQKNYKNAFFLIVGVGGSLLLAYITKIVLDDTFLSLKVTMNASAAFVVYMLIVHHIQYKKSLLTGLIVLPILLSLSSLYFHIYRLSDIIAGYMLGLFWVSLMVLLFDIKRIKSE